MVIERAMQLNMLAMFRDNDLTDARVRLLASAMVKAVGAYRQGELLENVYQPVCVYQGSITEALSLADARALSRSIIGSRMTEQGTETADAVAWRMCEVKTDMPGQWWPEGDPGSLLFLVDLDGDYCARWTTTAEEWHRWLSAKLARHEADWPGADVLDLNNIPKEP